MTNRLWETAIERAGALAAPFALDELPDADLLRRFLAARDEQAFAAIVRRHGPLVWGVCRNLLASEADAEDAFQATFLALVRFGHQVRRAQALGAWLHRVAGRVCRNSLRGLARRRKHERSAAVGESDRPVDAATWDRWHSAVHEEIDRLPDTLRVPFVLCVLQGLRQPEAARRLGWKLGTVSGRVCKAKQALADAVSRRGLAGAAVFTTAIGASAPLSAGLAARARAVFPAAGRPGDGLSQSIHQLARGATGGLMTKTKLLAAAVLAGTLALGAGTSWLSEAGAQGRPPDPAGSSAGGSGGGSGSAGKSGKLPGASDNPGMPPGMSRGYAGPKVEYQFVARPGRADAFKKLLSDHGNEGWEYVGLVPGEDELIFKRAQRPAGGLGGMAGGGMGMPGLPGMPGMPGMGGFPGGGGFGGAMGAGPFGDGGPAPKGAPPGKMGGLPMGGGGGAGPGAGLAKTPTQISLRAGETIRHKMESRQQIDGVFNHDLKVAEVSPDPTDARRVLLKGLAGGTARVELTDANGVKEEYLIRVR